MVGFQLTHFVVFALAVKRMVARAQTFLKCRGQSSQFYASNLCTLAVLNERGNVTCESLLESFLSSRSAWMESKTVEQPTEEDGAFAKHEQRLIVMLRTIISTLLNAEDIFLNANQIQSLMDPAFKILPNLQADFHQFTTNGKLEEHLNTWVSLERKKVRKGYILYCGLYSDYTVSFRLAKRPLKLFHVLQQSLSLRMFSRSFTLQTRKTEIIRVEKFGPRSVVDLLYQLHHAK